MSGLGADEAGRSASRELVRAGYDAISHAYRDDDGYPAVSSPERTETYQAWLEDLTARLPQRALVLDVGCGAGVPAARQLVGAGFRVTGVDISAVQIERARTLVPDATFLQADIVTWDGPHAGFDAIVALYALIHVPLEDQRQLIPRLAEWLVPGGYLLAIVGHERWTGVEEYLGAPMFWDHADAATYRRWLGEAGFALISDRFIPEGSGGHTLLLGQTGGPAT